MTATHGDTAARVARTTAAMRALVHLTWLETKVFVREPMGLVGTVAIPVAMFVVLSRVAGPGLARAAARSGGAIPTVLPVFASILMALSAVVSLVTIVSIYREGGILKRLRATPLSPLVILSAHVLVKLLFTSVTLAVMMLVGRRYFQPGVDVPVPSFGVALLLCTWALLSIGFLIASLVPTARFAQPLASVLLYPMVAISGLFFPIAALPPPLEALTRVLPLTYTVSLLDGIWRGEAWSAHLGDVTALALISVVLTAIASRVFRWE